MPIVFEEVTGEVDSRRGDAATETRGAANQGPSEDQVCQMVAEHLNVVKERCLRSLAD